MTNDIKLLIFFISISVFKISAQNDTLNKFDSKKRKIGYWVCFLDSSLNKTIKSKAVYHAYELYIEGVEIYHTGYRVFSVKHKEHYPDSISISTSRLISGKFILYDLKKNTKSVEIYKDGLLQSTHVYITEPKGYDGKGCHTEIFTDYTKKYKDQVGSYYLEMSSCKSNVKKLWSGRDKKGRWKFFPIED